MAPQLARLAKEHGDKVVVLKVDVGRYRTMGQKAGVRGIPDTRLLHKGRQVDRKVGSMGYQQLENMVLKNVGKLPPVKELVEEPVESEVAVAGASEPAAGEVTKQEQKEAIQPMKDDWLPPGVTRE